MNNVRRGSVSIPAVKEQHKEVKIDGLKSIGIKIEELVKKVEALEGRKHCMCDQVDSKLSKEIKIVSQQLKDLIEN